MTENFTSPWIEIPGKPGESISLAELQKRPHALKRTLEKLVETYPGREDLRRLLEKPPHARQSTAVHPDDD